MFASALAGPLVALSAAASWEPVPGELVENFGQIARVIEIDPERGVLVRAMPGQGFARGADRWYADPNKCRPVR